MSVAAITTEARPTGPSLAMLAAHEMRLAWRDWRGMVTAGGKRRLSTALLIVVVVAAALHLPAWAVVAQFGDLDAGSGKAVLASVTAVVLLYLSLLLSQALETVTRSLYSRGDLDLVLSSPVNPTRLFAVRIAANATLIAAMAVILSTPFIDVLVISGGPRWLAGFAVAAAGGYAMAAIAVAVTIGLFRLLGPRRTRVVAQVVAAVVGTTFAIGIQVAAILAYGNLGPGAFNLPPALLAALPEPGGMVWLPARAILGDAVALVAVLATSAVITGGVIALFAPRLGEHSLAATDLTIHHVSRARRVMFRSASPAAALRRKEWALLRRDPWLVSQTLTQLLYLLPPALLLARNYGNAAGALVVAVMVLVTVGGQLAGALAWLAISGEDAPDLVASAPVTPLAATRAKVEATFAALAIIVAPLLLVVAILSPWHALAAAIGIAVAGASTIRIQLWFRAQAKRSNFRRRHTSSRIATFGEALVSFGWAGAAGLAVTGTWLAVIPAVVALIILAGVRALSPRKAAA